MAWDYNPFTGTIDRIGSGSSGVGVPVGGNTGQVLSKASNTDYDTEWSTPAGGGDMLASVYDPTNIAASAFARANQTGTQTASTISDFDTEVANNSAVTANTAKVTNATHTGDVTGATALTIADNAVTNAKLANVATSTIKGRVTASTGDPEDLTATQVRTLLNVANGATANSPDATLLARANHTGTQTASTISDFDTEVSNNTDVASNTTHRGLTNNPHSVTADQVLPSQTSQSGKYLTTNGTTVSWGTVSGGGAVDSVNGQTGVVVLDADDIDDTSTTHKFVTASDLTKLSNTSGTNTGDQDISNFETTTQLNTRDTNNRARANHTGTQTASTISDFQTAVSSNTDVTANTAKVTNATHTGDVTGATALTIANDAVTNAKLANVATATIKGRVTASTGDPEDLTATQVRTLINVADGATANSSDATLLARANHTGTQAISTVTDLQTTLDGKAPTSHTHSTTDLTATGGSGTSFLRKDNTWATPTNTTYTEISEAEITAGTASTLRTITGRRAGFIKDRANHTGTQTASTISDFQTTVSANTDVSANTSARHSAVALAGSLDYLTLTGQQLTRNPIDLTTDVTGDLPITEGGTGSSTAAGAFSNLKQSATTSATGVVELATDAEAQAMSDTSRAITPSNLSAILTSGWYTHGLSGVTITRQSTDNPTVVLRFNADVTDYIWKGTRIKATENSIVHYFIVSADPVFSSPNTDVTCLSEIDTTTPTQAKNLIGATTISDVAYAPPKTYPKGFPIAKQSWRILVTDSSARTQSSPTSGTWYNPGGLNIVRPIGDYILGYSANGRMLDTGGSGSLAFNVYVSLSTSSSSESNSLLTGYANASGTGSTQVASTFNREIYDSGSTKQTYYLIIRTTSTDSADDVRLDNTQVPAVMYATSTLL